MVTQIIRHEWGDLWGHAIKLRRHPFASPTKRSDLKFKLFSSPALPSHRVFGIGYIVSI